MQIIINSWLSIKLLDHEVSNYAWSTFLESPTTLIDLKKNGAQRTMIKIKQIT